MAKVVLRDGRILDLSDDQFNKLTMLILMTTSLNRDVRVGGEAFNLQDIVTDKAEIARVTQQSLLQ
ncbi:MAG TPA: hypothetical protein VFL85_01630 [Candidatus Saccharimonadales bacterium]|nr:hypothetical protein [Candidatus Saccharimonadales bacterium]